MHLAVNDAYVGYDSLICVVVTIENKGTQRYISLPMRWRHVFHDRFEDILDASAFLRGGHYHFVAGEGDHMLDLVRYHIRLRGGEVDLVDHGDNRQVVFECK